MSEKDLDNGMSGREKELIEKGRQAELLEAIRSVVRSEVRESFISHFGDRKPEEVLELIRITEQFHRRMDKLTDSFMGHVFAWATKIGLWLLLIYLTAKAADVNIPKLSGGSP
ncbi:hypothetical protein [Dyella telluris]|uniref:Uncharacterized protein n=1 Tax=Dyella telluris TaxID=2763498 RepID=A0A7G8Q4E5_9GAMM|nr:hypothetical protein [Dyella telluris]QNK01653.1 hypothetical protein H8F01_00285 [Dyella telluris]